MSDKQILTLSMLGLVLINIYTTFTATFYFSTYSFLIKQAIFIVIGLFLGYMIYLVITSGDNIVKSLGRFYKVNLFFVFLTVILSILLFILPESFLPTINGAKRWIKIGGMTIAPIEITKLSFIFIFTHIFTSSKFQDNKDTKNLAVFVPIYILFAIYLIVITYKQKDLGNFFLFSTVFMTMSILFFNKIRIVFKMLGIGVVMLLVMIMSSGHRRDRIMQWFESTKGVGNASANYQVEQGFFAINEGGLFGVGPGSGVMKLGYIPEPHTDMVIPVLVNELGLLGLLGYMLLLFGLGYVMVKKAIKLNNLYLFNFIILTFLLLSYQIIINLFGVLGIIPLKGINVPFLSYGGSSVVSIIVLLFLCFSLIKTLEKKPI